MNVMVTWRNDNPNTISNRLAARLGRRPTAEEERAEVRRILSEVTVDLAGQGKLPHQRKRA